MAVQYYFCTMTKRGNNSGSTVLVLYYEKNGHNSGSTVLVLYYDKKK